MADQADRYRINRLVIRNAASATLASLQHDDGCPYASLVNVATDAAGWPVLLISSLAWHTRNLMADSRASLLFTANGEHADALQGARVTVLGRFERCDVAAVRERYLALHVPARGYAGFGDFAVWRMQPERLHAVAGFGRIESMPAGEVMLAPGIARAFEDLCRDDLARLEAAGGRVSGIDPDGVFIERGDTVSRANFASCMETPQDALAAVRAGAFETG